ncbi:MAG: hypothetical protein WBN43_15805 [Thiogranum sp.]
MISIFTATAFGLRSMLESIATRCFALLCESEWQILDVPPLF